MPGRYFLTSPMADIATWFGWTGVLPTDGPRRNIAPGETVVIFDAQGLVHARWGLIPVGRVDARGRPVMDQIVNARSETVFDKSAFKGLGRAVVPLDGWYEWTGQVRRKQPWAISSAAGGLMCFAAITDLWTAPNGQAVKQVATLTCEPSGDVRDIHDRMGVILTADQVDLWLNGTQDAVKPLLRPFPDGRLTVRKADGVDWTGA